MRVAPTMLAATRQAAALGAASTFPTSPAAAHLPVPGPELPAVPPRHPALPSPVPNLDALARIADTAPAAGRFEPGSPPASLRNAHYSNTRSQLAWALARGYNSLEGDVRLTPDGVPVMRHDATAPADLTFDQWATLAHRAGRHLRIDLKEATALPKVTAILERLGVPPGSITFNVGVSAPWAPANVHVDAIRALRIRFPGSWITLNLPLPLGPGFVLASRVARLLGPDHLGVAVSPRLVRAADVAFLRRHFAVVNAWNLPSLGDLDITAATARLRAIGVNGMIDLRRRDDPLAND